MFNFLKILIFIILFIPQSVFADEVYFIWDENSESDLKGYRVYSSQNINDGYVLEKEIFENNTVVDIEPDTYITVTAFDNNFNESDKSSPPWFYETQAPEVPKGLRITIDIGVVVGN